MDHNEPLLLSVKDAALKVGVSRWTMYDLARRGVIKSRKQGSRVLVEHDALTAYVDSLPVHGEQVSA